MGKFRKNILLRSGIVFMAVAVLITGMFSTLRLVLPVPVIATESSGRNLMQCRLTGKDL